jgi:hypothetical protein
MSIVMPLRLLHWEGRCLYYGGLWVGEVMTQSSGLRSGQWRAWVLTEAPGAHHGWFASESEARRQVETVVRAALPRVVDSRLQAGIAPE